ncbi:DUF488 family protein [Microvirga terricola]|uniref:DUF488 domain-containing protein n=1 Tax=Microvirga terricola TaxID=2719797 RepID=A0ABX0VFY5_9HYPH|nr:DUF488 domain-containing protein [Microvirga terricola]NIX78124.1 DUF488 domain-containing protein [Microvirga terricola]
MKKPHVFTIGYEGADLDHFVTTLKDAGVAVLVDVRAVASSRKRGFSKFLLQDELAHHGIGYRHFIELGTPKAGREAVRAGHPERMRKIYCDEVLSTKPAQDALEEVADLAKHQPICLLCFERDPTTCHRHIIAERLAKRGIMVTDLFVMP